APFLEQFGEGDGAVAVEAVARRQRRGLALVVVVTRRAFFLEFLPHDRRRDDGLHPRLFGVLPGFHHANLTREALLDDVGEMLALFVQHVRIVGGESRLAVAHDEDVGKAARMYAVQGRDAILPLVAQGNAATAVELIARAARIIRSDFEARGIDQAIDFIFLAVGDDAVLGDALHAFAVRI